MANPLELFFGGFCERYCQFDGCVGQGPERGGEPLSLSRNVPGRQTYYANNNLAANYSNRWHKAWIKPKRIGIG